MMKLCTLAYAHACGEAPGRCPVLHAASPLSYTVRRVFNGIFVTLDISGRDFALGYFSRNRFVYEDVRVFTSLSVENLVYVFFFIFTYRVSISLSVLSPLKYLRGAYTGPFVLRSSRTFLDIS